MAEPTVPELFEAAGRQLLQEFRHIRETNPHIDEKGSETKFVPHKAVARETRVVAVINQGSEPVSAPEKTCMAQTECGAPERNELRRAIAEMAYCFGKSAAPRAGMASAA